MKFVVQRVNNASCTVDEKITGKIDKGFLVFIGVSNEDTEEIADKMVKKLLGLRIFDDEAGKTNLALKDVGGSLLLISQFTLYADCSHGNRPSFINAGAPDMAEKLYEYIISKVRAEGYTAETGIFGAEMTIKLENDGPFTIILDSRDIIKLK
ncbi:MAG: D-tyrosyl-tRNA(Tyr) deacylase [Eubacterium sp.]|nr:D-tyrosyl-tRNA(Tyr) deacylase [Eubacterium sp.]HBE09587.1 D-tyrosyl-tRNA(Tyr) deacylase [Lachnospiraceae bacterium]